MNRPEEQMQRAVAAFLDAALPPDAVWWAVPNQRGTRKRFEMGVLKALGVKPGVPDVQVIHRGRPILIELKAPKNGRRSPDQVEMHNRITLAGGVVATCRSVEEVAAFLGQIVPLRGRLA